MKKILYTLCLLVALLGLSEKTWATNYFRIKVQAVYPSGVSGAHMYAGLWSGWSSSFPAEADRPLDEFTTGVLSSSSNPDVELVTSVVEGTEFLGWYKDEACTILASGSLEYNAYGSSSGIAVSTDEASAPTTTFYAKYAKSSVVWSDYAEAPVAGGKYYLYSAGFNALAGLYTYSDGKVVRGYKDANQAVLFTVSDATNPQISCVDEGVTKYVNKNGTYIETTAPAAKTLVLKSDGSYMINLNNGHSSGYTWWEMQNSTYSPGSCTKSTINESSATQRWRFIPEAAYNALCTVESLNESGSITIDAAPTASGSTTVKFNVSEVGPVAAYDYTIEGGDGNFVLGTPTRKDNIITVPVTYTAQNVHSGTFSPISTATVRITAKNPEASTAAGLVPVYVNLSPQFALNVDALDWSYDGDDLVETYYAGMEVAASQRERLLNKLIYNPAQTTGVAANYATWTATIIGDYAAQYKFANGTQTVSGPYSPELLDVIFAPTATGEFPATLHVETSYTDANNTVLKCTKDISLYGKAEAVSVITFEADADQSPSNDEHYSYGEIIGTNSKDVSVDLFMVGITGATKVWSDPDDVFEFDVNSIDFSKTNQTLMFRAHRTTPVTSATNHTATLTISGIGSEGTVTGVLTLAYQALPLLTPEVTWNWSTVEEGTVATNPLSTTSDGVWVLTKTGGDKVTYNDEAKSVTTAYVHHEPNQTATFALSIPQTDTYAAYNQSHELLIIPQQLQINTTAKYEQYMEVRYSEWFDESKGEFYYDYYDHIYFLLQGQTKMTFNYRNKNNVADWIITEHFADNTTNVIFTGNFNVGANELTFSPNAVKLEFYAYSSAYFTDIRLLDYTDAITADYDKVILINDNGTIHDLAVTATFSNTYSATVALNAAAQPYFELQTAGKASGASIVFDNNDLGLGQVKDKVITITLKEGADAAAAAAATVGGACQVTFGDNYTYNHHEFSLPVTLIDAYDVTYKKHAHGTYTVTYADDTEHPQTVSSADFVKHLTSIAPEHTTVTLSAPTPASGYVFQGWKINDVLVSCKSSITKIIDEAATVEPVFAVTDGTFKIDDALFSELSEALGIAGAIADQEPVVTLMKDLALTEPATYTIPAGVTLLIPYKANFNELQTEPEITTTATVLSAYRTLTLKEGVNIICNGNICVSGKIMAAGGGNKSAYTTGECGVINMANGGHIELNDGAQLYCWGYIKGQDMDQGNNTQDVGTVTVNAGAIVNENFELGDWRGGTATSNIYFEKDEKRLFPFQSYALQNVEIPTTYKYGSKLKGFLVVHTGYGDIPFVVSIIGSEETLFLLQDEESIIRKWYDPTTDLSCFELNGTSQLDQLILNLPFVGDFESGDCNLPISNSMHIMLANCNMTLSKPLTVQAGAVIEIKNTATVNLTSKIHLFDVDEWGLYIHNYYFRSFNNLTSHKDRGAENSKAGLEDAKFIIDGTLNVVKNQGYIYSTAGGASLMGNGGGVINFLGALPAANEIWQVHVLSGSPYITWVSTSEAAANLHNEDGSYTKSEGFTSYYNIHGRWFYEANKEPLEDHTYDFYYLDNGNTGDEEWSAAVYSHDKTGLTAGMKWFNVVRAADNCTDIEEDLEKPFTSNWWLDTIANPKVYYNYTMLGDWHQFQSTEEAGVYSGSNNVLYQKDGCEWVETGAVDENCLYTFYEGGLPVKKALVEGHFISLTSNGYDPAYYHEENEVKTYYICFQGCNWHEATPYVGESKAYTIVAGGTYIWFNNDWLNVEREEPFFYTADEVTNVKTYYEYVNGEWEVATPFVRVQDNMETREFYMIKEAFNVASIKKNATITILRDIPNVTESLVYTTQNTTCTLDLNGHIVTSSCANLLNINAPGSTFKIVDNSTYQNGELRAMPEGGNARTYGYTVTAGTLVLESGKMYSTNTTTRTGSTAAAFTSATNTGITIKANAVFTMTGGVFESEDEHQPYAVRVETNGTMNLSGGEVIAHATKWQSTRGVSLENGKLNMSGGKISSTAVGTTVYGVVIGASASYNQSKNTQSTSYGTFTLTGGDIFAQSTNDARGVHVSGAADVTGDYNESVFDKTIKVREYGRFNMSGGTVTAECTTNSSAYGVLSYGTTTISGGTITANVLKSNRSTAFGVRTNGGTTTIKSGAVVIANAPTIAYALSCSGANGDSNRGWAHVGNMDVQGGTFTANTTNTITAYGLYVTGTTWNINKTNSYSVFNGDYAAAGTATVTGGTFIANAKTTDAGGIKVDNTVIKNEAFATPVCTINGGSYKATGTGTLNGCAGTALPANFRVNGGIYSHEGNLVTYANAEANKIVVTLPKTDANYPDYKYEVAEGYTITFKNGEETLQATAQKSGTTPTYNGVEPTKDDTDEPKTKSYIFDGWSTTDGGDVVALATVSAEATYFAHFNETTLKHRVTLDAQTNGGVEETQIIYVDPASAIGTLPTATKAGYTFQGWFSVSAATGGDKLEESTEINADATYYARFAINKHTLTWNLNGGKVTTAGTVAAKNAEGSPSGLVDYKANITAPVIAKTGYTFKNWGVAVAASMPDNDLTYTAVWTPKTNTAYTVKHFKQNLDGTYPAEPADIDELTGTTEAYVTPAVKTYDGFVSPATQTAQITGNGGLVVTYQYARREYTITLDANGGACATASLNVLHGATLTLPEATQEGYTFDGWFTKPVGGDPVTNETVIQRNIGTLYAQFTEAITETTDIIAGRGADAEAVDIILTDPDIEAHALIIEKDGRVNIIPGASVSVQDFILESDGSKSGQLLGSSADRLTIADGHHAYFDLTLNTHPRNWYAVAVPWEVDAAHGISIKGGRTLKIGRDFDLVYYDGGVRASQGKVYECWQYVNDFAEADQKMIPGQFYMMYFVSDIETIRFESVDNTPFDEAVHGVEVHPQSTGNAGDADWNGIANPKPFHARLNAGGATYGYYLNNGNLDEYLVGQGQPTYQLVNLASYTAIVGKPLYIQATVSDDISALATIAASAPRRLRDIEVENGIESVYEITFGAENAPTRDNMFIQTVSNKADGYVVGMDLVKAGTDAHKPQLWISRYGNNLAVNTIAPENGVCEYPLTLNVPQSGRYTIAVRDTQGEPVALYLLRNGELLWNLSEGAYTGSFDQGTHTGYSLRTAAKAPQTATGIEEALVDAHGDTRKVLIDNKVYIIRGNEIYTIDGRLVK